MWHLSIRAMPLILSTACFVIVVFLASIREYTSFGALSIAAMLYLLGASLVFLTGKIVTVFSGLATLLIVLHIADQIKFSLLRYHIQLQDIQTLSDQIFSGDFSIISQYPVLALGAVLALVALFAQVVSTLRIDQKLAGAGLGFKRNIPAALVFFGGIISISIILDASPYVKTIKDLHLNRLMGDQRPGRLSVALVSTWESLRLRNLLVHEYSEPQYAPDSRSVSCTDICPDIYIVHMESVFDPIIATGYEEHPSVGELILEGQDGAHGLMEVSVWGGFSWVTEFEMVCGLNHALFGWAGRYSHYNVAPYMKGCLGKAIEPLGYDGQVYYTTRRSFLAVEKAFSNYGFGTFYDRDDLELPRAGRLITDEMMFQNLFDNLDYSGDRRQLIWLSTNWNHGPHGKRHAKPDKIGPYDPNSAPDPAFADYVNRLNYTIDLARELKRRIALRDRPTVVLMYGDHHPHFDKEYQQPYRDKGDYLTPYVMFRNFDGPTFSLPDV